jgi:transposase
VMNQLPAIAMNEGVRRKRGLWSQKGRSQLESLTLPQWTSWRRQELLELLDRFDPSIDDLTKAVEQEARRRPEVEQLQTHPGMGPVTALAYVLVLGTPDRFPCGKQVGSYLGLIPCEDSSADHWRLGHISKQGNSLVRYLLVQSALSAARVEEGIANTCTWRCAAITLSRRSRWPVSWRSACSGCGGRDGITRSGRSSARTWGSSSIAMVCSRSPSN